MASGLYWLAALAAVGSLYLPALLGERSAGVVAAVAVLVFGGLLAGVFVPRDVRMGRREPARASVAFLVTAIGLFTASTVWAAATKPLDVRDLGVFALQAAVPIALLASPRRADLLKALGWTCVLFATLDAGANLLASAGVFDLPAYGGRVDAAGVHVRYPGLSGNTLAAGLVAFVAIGFLASRLSWKRVLFVAPLIVALFVSLWLIDARRYLALAALAVSLIAWRPATRIPLPLVAIVVGATGLSAAFSPVFDDELRSLLIRQGVGLAAAHPVLGEGPQWRDTSTLVANFENLSAAGVTESGILDLAVAYGVIASVALLLSALLAMGRRRLDRLPAVLLCLLTASLAFSDPLNGYLGALVFFAALACCQT